MTDHLFEQWETNAKAFASLINGRGTPHHREILNPCLDRLMGDVQGLRILDAGCGEGYLSRHYAKQGATVICIDLSPTLIEICINLSQGLNIKYLQGDICDLNSIDDAQFDRVLCNLVLLNVKCLDSALREFYRVLVSSGSVVFSVVHPAFNIYGPGRWELGEKDSQSDRRIGRHFKLDHYFVEKEYQVRWKRRSGEGFPMKFSFFHRTLQTYIAAVLKTGFRLVAFEEPVPVTDKPFFDRERRVPFFVVIKAMKP